MQKYTEPCINTSKFAKLCNTNKRTLIHYDEIGLFKPAYIDERGYRYYSENQCDVFFTITCLKDLGMPLKEIKTYVTHQNPTDLRLLLLEQEKKVQQELLHLKRIQQVIRNKLTLVSEGRELIFDETHCTKPFLASFEEEYFVTSPYLDTAEHTLLISSLFEHIVEVNHRHLNIGHPYGAIMNVSDLLDGNFDCYAYFMTKVTTPHSDCISHQKAAGIYAVLYLQGDYYNAEYAFQKLLDYIQEEHLIPGKYCYKEAVWDELTVDDKSKYITRISIPILS